MKLDYSLKNMTLRAYYTMIDHRDCITENENWDWNKIMDVLNEKLMPEYKAVAGTYCPDIQHFLSAYDNPPIFVHASDTVNYSELNSGQLFMLQKQDDIDNCITTIYTNDPDIIAEQNLDYYSSSDGEPHWEEDYGPVSPEKNK